MDILKARIEFFKQKETEYSKIRYSLIVPGTFVSNMIKTDPNDLNFRWLGDIVIVSWIGKAPDDIPYKNIEDILVNGHTFTVGDFLK